MAETAIHPSAIVEPGAVLGQGVRIGPFCHVGPLVRLGDGVELKSHVVVAGDTEIGAGTVVFPFACIGEAPQDLKYAGEDTRLVIGARNRIREYVTMNPGTAGGGGLTQVGDDGLFMACSHVAHDCRIGNHVILVNSVAVAGHCVLEDDVIVGGLSGVHQWVRIGRGAMIGAVTNRYGLPGVIDTQVHFREPGLEWKEDLETGSRAAALGGVVAVFEMPNTNPQTTTAEALADKVARAHHRMHCDFAFWVGGTHENAHAVATAEQFFGDETADESGAPGDQHAHVSRALRCRRQMTMQTMMTL